MTDNKSKFLGYHATKTKWFEKDMFISRTGWACIHCFKETKTKYIATGHDHTDYEYDTCNCEGAVNNGKPWSELL